MMQKHRAITGDNRLPSLNGIVSVVLIFSLVFSSLPLYAEESKATATEARTLAVLDITSDELDAPTLKKLNGSVAALLKKEAGTAVITQAEILKLEEFGDESKRMNCTENASCMVELSDYIKSELIFSGKIGKVGAIWTVSLQILDASRGAAAARVSLETSSKEELTDTALNATRKLLQEWGQKAESLSVNIADLGANPKIAVMDFSAMGVDKALATNLTDVLTVELKQFKGFQVISRQEIGTMLNFEAVRQGAGCDDEGCFAEIGNALGVNVLVTGTVGKVEETYLINLKLIDIRNARIIGREQEDFTGSADGLLPAVRFCLRKVLNSPYEGAGFLKIISSEDKTTVKLNGEELGQTPKLNIPQSLPSGKYRLDAEKKNFYPLAQDVYVEPARQTPVQLQLLQRPTPWWKSWWFWTITGTLVAGAVTTGVVLGTMSGGKADSGSGKVTIPAN